MCPHATTTTVAFLYGEADWAHAAHVAACPDCARVAEDHAAVVTALGPALAQVRPVRRAPGRWWPAMAVAAAALAVVCAVVDRAPPAPAVDADQALDALEIELASFDWEDP